MIQYIKIKFQLQIASLLPIKLSLIFGENLDGISYKIFKRPKEREIMPFDIIKFAYLFRASKPCKSVKSGMEVVHEQAFSLDFWHLHTSFSQNSEEQRQNWNTFI